VLSKVACLLESQFVADIGKDRRDGILGDDSSGYHIRQNAYRLGACGRMHAFADHLPNTKPMVDSGFLKCNADDLPHLHRTTDR